MLHSSPNLIMFFMHPTFTGLLFVKLFEICFYHFLHLRACFTCSSVHTSTLLMVLTPLWSVGKCVITSSQFIYINIVFLPLLFALKCCLMYCSLPHKPFLLLISFTYELASLAHLYMPQLFWWYSLLYDLWVIVYYTYSWFICINIVFLPLLLVFIMKCCFNALLSAS